MGKAKKWTNEEINFLKENADMPIENLSKRLNRTPSAIRLRKHIEGLSPHHYRYDDFVLKNYQKMTTSEICKATGARRATIQFAIKRLGLFDKHLKAPSAIPWEDWELELIKQGLSIEDIACETGRTETAVQSKKYAFKSKKRKQKKLPH